jgi:hypothetical protein
MIYAFNRMTTTCAPYMSIFHYMSKAVHVQKRQTEFKACGRIGRCFYIDSENRMLLHLSNIQYADTIIMFVVTEPEVSIQVAAERVRCN